MGIQNLPPRTTVSAEAMWKSIRSFAFSNSVKSTKIEVSELEHVAILGAAALHYDAELAFS